MQARGKRARGKLLPAQGFRSASSAMQAAWPSSDTSTAACGCATLHPVVPERHRDQFASGLAAEWSI